MWLTEESVPDRFPLVTLGLCGGTGWAPAGLSAVRLGRKAGGCGPAGDRPTRGQCALSPLSPGPGVLRKQSRTPPEGKATKATLR